MTAQTGSDLTGFSEDLRSQYQPGGKVLTRSLYNEEDEVSLISVFHVKSGSALNPLEPEKHGRFLLRTRRSETLTIKIQTDFHSEDQDLSFIPD